MVYLRKLAGASAITLAVCAGVGASQVAYAADQAPDVGQHQTVALPGAPCVVTGYSFHAQQQMAARKITSDEVESLVHYTCNSATWQGPPKNTWLYLGKRIGVAANDNGYVVTAFLR